MLAQRPVGGQAAFRRDASFDTDRDGMPDVWEIRHGLNPVAANNNADFDADGYTDLEEYLNDISAWPAPAPIECAAAGGRYAEIGNWVVDTPTVTAAGAQNAFEDFHWQPSRFDTAVIHSGSVVVDAVGQHAGNLVLGMNPGDAVSFAITAGWLEVEDAQDGLSEGSR